MDVTEVRLRCFEILSRHYRVRNTAAATQDCERLVHYMMTGVPVFETSEPLEPAPEGVEYGEPINGVSRDG